MYCFKSVFHFSLGCFLCAAVTPAMAAEPPDAARQALRQAAREAAAESTVESAATAPQFTAGSLALQALNPEISITGDMLWYSRDGGSGEDMDSDFVFRSLGIHLQAYLDPYTRFKAAVEVHEEETELGEAYLTRFGFLPHVNLTLGKFRQPFGVVNRWHKHGLDQVDFPLALREIFGEDGLNQTGAALDWTLPETAGFSHDVQLQITDGENGRVFAENADNAPSVLLHYKLYRDLNPSTYAELGLSGLYGHNNAWPVGEERVDDKQSVWVLGADFTMLWEPVERMRYRNLTWRSEVYALHKDILAPDGSGPDTVEAWGAYSYLESKLARTWILGIRGDYFEPDTKTYADDPAGPIGPLAVMAGNASRWGLSPYVTWLQSPFVRFRAEYDHIDGNTATPDEDTVWLQVIFAAGPHKHERY